MNELLRLWLQSDEVVMVLVNHQRKDISGCICGWAELGKMHPRHVLEKLVELLDDGEESAVSGQDRC